MRQAALRWSSLVHGHGRTLVLQVQRVEAGRVGDEVEEAEHARCDVGTVIPVPTHRRPRGQLHDEGDEVQHRDDEGVDQLRQDPVDGQPEGLPDAQQVHEDPDEGGDEGGHDDEEEPVRGAGVGRGGERHAEDAEDRLHQLQDAGQRLEVVDVDPQPGQAARRLARVRHGSYSYPSVISDGT